MKLFYSLALTLIILLTGCTGFSTNSEQDANYEYVNESNWFSRKVLVRFEDNTPCNSARLEYQLGDNREVIYADNSGEINFGRYAWVSSTAKRISQRCYIYKDNTDQHVWQGSITLYRNSNIGPKIIVIPNN